MHRSNLDLVGVSSPLLFYRFLIFIAFFSQGTCNAIYLNPITIRVLEKYLFYIICTNVDLLRIPGPVEVLDFHRVQCFIKSSKLDVVNARWNALLVMIACSIAEMRRNSNPSANTTIGRLQFLTGSKFPEVSKSSCKTQWTGLRP